MAKIDKNLNKIILDTKILMVEKNGLIRTSLRAIFFGNTGSGKSTLARLLARKDVKIKIEKRIVKLVCEGIKSGNKAYTDLPEFIYDESSDLVYIDTPGYQDTRGYIQQIKNAFAIHDLFNPNNEEIKVKIILVIRAEAIGVDRSGNIQSFFKILNEMFPNLTETEKKSVGIVFTCEIRNQDQMYYIDKLDDDADEVTTNWCNYFRNHLDQVFILPEARGKDGQSFTFDDKEPLIDFVKKDQLVNPKPELALSEESKLYLRGGFLDHVSELLLEAGKIFQKIDDYFKSLTDILEIDKLSKRLHDISQIHIKSPHILKDAIEKNITDGTINFKRSFERLEDLNVLYSFFINALKIQDHEINEKIKTPMDAKINKLISKLDVHKKLIVEKQEAERKRQEAENKKKEEEKKRLDAEQKMQNAERKRQEEERKRQDAERKMQEEKEKRIEKEREIDKNRELIVFHLENNIKMKQIHNETKSKLGKGGIFYTSSYERKGICAELTSNQILITSNSVQPGSDPENVILSEDKYYFSEDKKDSYICFNFLRRKVKIDNFLIKDASDYKNCLIKYRVEGSNDANEWKYISSINDKDGSTPRDAIYNWTTVHHPYHSKEDEYKLYYKYIRIIQTGYSYNSYSYVMGIDNIEFFGSISEPIDI